MAVGHYFHCLQTANEEEREHREKGEEGGGEEQERKRGEDGEVGQGEEER